MKLIRILLVTMMIAVVAAANAADRRFTLVIDAGHGGHDSGAKGAMSYEKNINLRVALAFGKYVERNCPDVRVVYTRKTDVFVPLYERAEIANRNKANLFVSVHTNALAKGKISRGFETYTLGDGRSHGTKTNLDVAKRENSVIFMEKDYKQHYVGYDPNSAESNIMFEFVQDHNMQQSVEFAKMLQQNVCSMAGRINKGVHQDNFAVLRLTSMPACLIELGFITTPDEEQALNNADTVDKIARGIYNAFADYKNRQAGGLTVPFKANADKLPAEEDPQKETAQESLQQEAKQQETKQQETKQQEAKQQEAKQRQEVKQQSKPQPQANRQSGQKANEKVKTRSSLVTDEDGIILYDEGVTLPRLETEEQAAAVVREFAPDNNAFTNGKPASNGKSAIKGNAVTKDAGVSSGNGASEKDTETSCPVFKVQIMVCHSKLKEGDRNLKGLKGCEFYQENGDWKCTYGASTDYNETARLRKQILDLFPTCFIIAFKDGEKMNVNEAIREFKRNRNK